jgi:hypothetical protein
MSASRSIRILIPLLLLVPIPRAAQAQRWVSVDVGTWHTCALDSRGRAFCWGNNHHGELGARTPETCAAAHHGGGSTCYASASREPVAVAVGGGTHFRSISVGGNVSCGLDGDGRVWCWGQNVGSQEAGCASRHACSFDPLPFAPETAFRFLRVGEDAVCGITREGAGHCWRPVRGRPGKWAMTEVAPGETLAWLDHYGDWMARDEHVICAVTVEGRALCQGLNIFAQLGAGDTVPRPGAVRVASGARFVRVHPWASSTCGVTADGTVECWGAAEARPYWPGGTPSDSSFFACRMSAWCSGPREVAPGMRLSALTVVGDRFCGLQPTGEVHCWGVGRPPARVAEGVHFTTLEGGETHACGLTGEGAVWCWRNEPGAPGVQLVRAPDPPR